jgi:hypothetical protein
MREYVIEKFGCVRSQRFHSYFASSFFVCLSSHRLTVLIATLYCVICKGVFPSLLVHTKFGSFENKWRSCYRCTTTGTIHSLSEYQYYTILWGCYLNTDVSVLLFLQSSIIMSENKGLSSEMLVVMSEY